MEKFEKDNSNIQHSADSNNYLKNNVDNFNTLTEEEVGITQYINDHSKGFDCVLKHRYSDFLVNEIDQEGNVVWLSENKEKPKTEVPVNNYIQDDEEVDSILKENFIDTKLVTNEQDISNFREFLFKYFRKELNNEERLLIGYIEDKNDRKTFHDKVRTLFEFLDSETLSDAHGGSTFVNMSKKKFKNKSKKDSRKLSDENKNMPEQQSEEGKEFEKKMVVFFNKGKANFLKKRKMFPDSNKKVLHFSMMKRNMETVQAISYIARMLRRSYKTIKFAGNKDKRGVTTQRISAFSTVPEELMSLSKKSFWDRKIEIGNFEFKEDELKLGLLKGNQFSVVFRFIKMFDESADIETEVKSSLESLGEKGFINYFGMQRFGVGTIPTHKVGLNVIKNNWRDAVTCILFTQEVKDALRQIGQLKKITNEQGEINYQQFAELFESTEIINDVLRIVPKYSYENRILSSIKRTGKNSYLTAFTSLNRQLQLLYPHAYQSYIWNKTVSERLKNFGTQLLIGDIVKKKNIQTAEEIKSLNLLEGEIEEDIEEIIDEKNEDENEIKKESETNLTNANTTEKKEDIDVDKIFEDNYEYVTEDNISKYSYDDLYFPVVGSKVKYPKNECFDYIMRLLAKDSVKLEDFSSNNLNFNSTGYFRKMIEKPKGLAYDIIKHDLQDEDLQTENYNVKPHPTPKCQENKYTSLRLQFQLPQSTYATMLFRELTKKSSAANFQAGLSRVIKNTIK